MVVSKRDAQRLQAKGLKKIMEDKRLHPEKYIHEVGDLSRFRALKYDYDRGVLPPFKVDKYKELKEKLEQEGLI